MISLQDSSSLPVTFDERDNAIFFPNEVIYSRIERIKLSELNPVLLNKTLVYPDKVYNEYFDVCKLDDKASFDKHNLHYNLLVIPTGLLGVEYTKSHIYATGKDSKDLSGIVEVIKGGATVLLQKLEPKGEFDFETSIKDVYVVKMKQGERLPIPTGYQYSFVNTRNQSLVLSRVYKHDGKIDYRTIRKEQGLSYYVIRKNARQEYVKNPRYREIPKLRKDTTEKYQKRFSVTSSKSLYDQIINDPRRFSKILG